MIYSYSEIEHVHLEITSRCNAACSLCARTSGNSINPNLPIKELTIDQIKKIFSDLDFVGQIRTVSFCGNYGDPIIAKDFLKIISFFKTINPTIEIFVNTNGSIRNSKWWKILASMLSLNDVVIFSIDGLKDTNHIYRKNTNWEKIISNAKSFIDNGGRAQWEYIVFRHNEHQIDLAESISKELGFEKFVVKRSSRFNRDSQVLPPVNIHYKNKSFDNFMSETNFFLNNLPNDKFKTYVDNAEINCKVKKKKSIFITSEGYLHPCCWVGLQMYSKFHSYKGSQIWSYIDKVGLQNLNCIDNSIKTIIEGIYFEYIEKSWSLSSTTGKLNICAYTCGNRHDFYTDQYVNDKFDS